MNSTLTHAMKALKATLTTVRRVVGLALILAGISSVKAQVTGTIWNGTNMGFSHPEGGPADQILTNVTITRGGGGGLYNSALETGPSVGSPKGTQWALGTLAQYTNGTALSFGNCPLEAGMRPPNDVGKTYVVHLITNNIYLQLTLTNWGGMGGSGTTSFGYIRSTPPAAIVLPTPTISITNPPNNAVFAAPANVSIAANASVSGGSVTNVQFFANNSSIGSVRAMPFTLTANHLLAGAYALTAVATASGISATSAVVNISVVTPITTTLSNNYTFTGTNFQFSYAANVGLRYVVQVSTNLVSPNWIPLVTNTAASNPVVFVDVHATNNTGYYRVGRLQNP